MIQIVKEQSKGVGEDNDAWKDILVLVVQEVWRWN